VDSTTRPADARSAVQVRPVPPLTQNVWGSIITIMWKLLGFVAFGLAIALLAFFEILDVSGRLDILEKKHPKLWGLANRRPARLLLLVMCAGFLAKDIRTQQTFLTRRQLNFNRL
jgi:hypothetical protein